MVFWFVFLCLFWQFKARESDVFKITVGLAAIPTDTAIINAQPVPQTEDGKPVQKVMNSRLQRVILEGPDRVHR